VGVAVGGIGVAVSASASATAAAGGEELHPVSRNSPTIIIVIKSLFIFASCKNRPGFFYVAVVQYTNRQVHSPTFWLIWPGVA
jgi:hypothetical protein